MGFFTGLKNEFETAVINEPTVFEPLKFYCMRQVLIKNENCFKRCEFFIIAMSQLLLILNMCYRLANIWITLICLNIETHSNH